MSHHSKMVGSWPRISDSEKQRILSAFKSCVDKAVVPRVEHVRVTGVTAGGTEYSVSLPAEKRFRREKFRTAWRRADAGAFGHLETLLSMIFDLETPTPNLNFGNASSFSEIDLFVPAEMREQWNWVGKMVDRILYERGYRHSSNLWTWQEHTAGGSTVSKEYRLAPYVPLGILNNRLKLDETQRARDLEVWGLGADRFSFEGCAKADAKMTLERLGPDTNTLEDPRAANKKELLRHLKLYPLAEAIEASLVPNAIKNQEFPKPRI